MINCEHVIVQHVFFPVNCKKLHPTSLIKIVEITMCNISDFLRDDCKRNMSEESTTCHGVICAEILPLWALSLFPREENDLSP